MFAVPDVDVKSELARGLPANVLAIIRSNLADRSDEEFDLHVAEFLKFMFLCSTYGASFIPLSKDVDDVWHECIMQTKFYADLCSRMPGRRFIHHESVSLEDYAERHGRDHVIRQMLDWLPNYYLHFGAFTEATAPLWTIVRFLQAEMGLSLESVNTLAKSEAERKRAKTCSPAGIDAA